MGTITETPNRAEIDNAIEQAIAAMPDGMSGFLKTWGLCEFAFALVKIVTNSGRRYEHVKTGRIYVYLTEGMRESDCEEQVIYRSTLDDVVWIRPKSEFFDGRFRELP